MRGIVLLLVAGAVAGAGCISEPSGLYPPACGTDGPLMWGALEGRAAPPDWMHAANPQTDPRQPWKTVLAMRGDPSYGLAVEWGNEETRLEWLGNSTDRLAIVSQEGPAGPVGFTVTAEGVDCRRFPTPDWPAFAPPREGATVEVGKGALVHTAGFWENGTLFYTNMPEIHDGPDWDGKVWPRAGWYAYAGEEPLQVYVYDKEREEMPPHWSAGHGVPDGPVSTDVLPGRYVTTIPGFNEALKGLATSTLTAVRIAPEEAYTRPGHEDHPLYGDALVFLIGVEAVADHPCAGQGVEVSPSPPSPCFRT